MKLPAVCRNALLLTGLFVLGLTSAVAADWPRQVTDSRGVHTLESKPTRIVSTSVTLTGSLLAIDAPVIASGATTPNNRVADAQASCASGEILQNSVRLRGCTSVSRAPKRSRPRCRT